jgi:hypothetical protein
VSCDTVEGKEIEAGDPLDVALPARVSVAVDKVMTRTLKSMVTVTVVQVPTAMGWREARLMPPLLTLVGEAIRLDESVMDAPVQKKRAGRREPATPTFVPVAVRCNMLLQTPTTELESRSNVRE